MSANAGSGIPITWEELAPHRKTVTQYLTGISYVPKKTVEAMRSGDAPKARMEYATSRATDTAKVESVGIIKIAKAVSKDDDVLDEPVNAALIVIRTGLQVALQIASLYAKASGLATLRQRRDAARGSFPDEAEWLSKEETHSAVTAFVLASYIGWRFESKDEKKYTANVDFAGLPEPVPLGNQIRTIGGVLYHLGSYLNTAQTGTQFHKLVQLYFAAVLKEIQIRTSSLKFAEPFLESVYKLADTTFTVNGFKAAALSTGVVEFKRVELREVVGNQEAKRLARRLAQFVMAYDVNRQMNPLMELGAFPWIGVFQGWAGTGKSMLLGVLQTLVQDYCKALGVPFELHPIPNGIISSLQGDSAINYENWWSRLSNPNAIIVAPVDDAEAVYLDRRSQSSSEGSKLIVMSHLRLTEGSTALTRGNVLQPHATNNADMIDAPVFSRYQYRVVVPGAQTRNDFMDQMRLWGDSLNKKAGDGKLIDLHWPADYQYLSDQGFIPVDEKDKKAGELIRFKDNGLVRLWEEVEKRKLPTNSYDLYGSFFAALHKKFPQFTSRDVRNVTVSATSRLFGFDFPPEWFESREALVGKDYDAKKKLILDTAVGYQNGLTVDQVLFQELVHYVESTIEMLDSGRKYRIRKMADEQKERIEAMELAKSEMLAGQPAAVAA